MELEPNESNNRMNKTEIGPTSVVNITIDVIMSDAATTGATTKLLHQEELPLL